MFEVLEALFGDKGALEVEMLQSLAPLDRKSRQALAEHVIVNEAIREVERHAGSRKRQHFELQIVHRRLDVAEVERVELVQNHAALCLDAVRVRI